MGRDWRGRADGGSGGWAEGWEGPGRRETEVEGRKGRAGTGNEGTEGLSGVPGAGGSDEGPWGWMVEGHQDSREHGGGSLGLTGDVGGCARGGGAVVRVEREDPCGNGGSLGAARVGR